MIIWIVFFKQKTAYEMRISDWSSDVCSSDLRMLGPLTRGEERACFGISEPNTGLDTTRVSMRATWDGTNYIATGTKVWPTMASTAARIMLLARTTPIDQCKRPVDGQIGRASCR